MAEAFLVRDFERELPYVFLYYIILSYYYLVSLVCAIHAKHVTITLRDIDLINNLRVINGGKSYNEEAYATNTAKMSNSINPN